MAAGPYSRPMRLRRGTPRKLREIADRMLVDADMLPGRTELKQMLAEAVPDDHQDMAPVRAAIEKRLVEFAQQAQDRSARFELRGLVGDFAIETGEMLDQRDRLVTPADEPEPIDVDHVSTSALDPRGERERVASWFAA